MKVFFVSHHTKSLLNFRGQLLSEFVQTGHDVTVCSPENDPECIEKLSGMGIAYITFPLARNGMNPIKDLYAFFFLVKTLVRIKPDLVFSVSTKPVIYGSLASRFAGVSRVFSMISGAGYVFTEGGFKRKLINLLARILFCLALKNNVSVFFLNPDDRSLFVRLGLVRQELTVLIDGEGVDLEQFQPVPLPKKSPVFLLICRLIKDKGVVEYVEAARIVKRRYPEATFDLLGPFDDNNTSALSRPQIEQWHQEGIINYCGETDDIRPFLSASSVFVLPSYYEGTPRTTLEAMATGRPILTTDVAGCRETVIEGKNGFLVPLKDVNALAEAMEKFIVDPDLIVRMGETSREIVVKRFDVHKVNARIMEVMGLLREKPSQSQAI